MWREDETVMISAIEHYSYCARQCGLIHIEDVFDENVYTLRGSAAHERVDTPTWETLADGGRVERALPLWSEQYGLHGRADAVEFRADGTLFPVEYKHGHKRETRHDALQLVAQAVCLEEMFGQRVTSGAIYYHSTKRRRDVELTAELRDEMAEIVAQIRDMKRAGTLPPPVHDARCPNCSLIDACVPFALEAGRQARHLRRFQRLDDPGTSCNKENTP